MVSRLRKKLDPEGLIQPISTIRRQGYIFTLLQLMPLCHAAPMTLIRRSLHLEADAGKRHAGHRAHHGLLRLYPLPRPRRGAGPESQHPHAGEPLQVVLLLRQPEPHAITDLGG